MSKQLRIWLFVLLSTLLTSTTLPAEGVITMTTAKRVGEKISLVIEANSDVTIQGVEESARTDGQSKYYTLTSQTITIRGDVTILKCYGNQLTSLDVSDCVTLTTLYCGSNQLTSLDVSKNIALMSLVCTSNQLTSLDVSGCTALTELCCPYNQLTSLDVSGCTALTGLGCYNNTLTSLDVSKNTALYWLNCSSNQLTSLDVSKNTALEYFFCYSNRINGEAMTKLVNSLPDRTGKSPGIFRVMDSGSDEKNQCSPSDISIVRDKNWSPMWSSGDPYIASGEWVSTMTTSKAVGEKISLAIKANGNVTIEGVGETPQLDGRHHSYTLTSQTVTIRGHVASLKCSHNQLTGLDLTRSTALTSLDCSDNKLTSLDLSKNAALTTLKCYNNQLTNLDLSENKALKTLDCVSNQLTSLDLSNHSTLESLSCEKNQLIRLNLSGCSGLKKLYCQTNQLIRLDISACRGLTTLRCNGNQLTSLNASGCSSLTVLDCGSNPLRRLDVSSCTALKWLYCQENQLTSLDVSKNTALEYFFCYSNRINGEAMTKLVNSLPNRTGKSPGTFSVMDSGSSEKNQCSPSDISIVRDKNWNPEDSYGNPYITPGEWVSTMTTSKAVGETINLKIKANGKVTIEGVGETPQLDGQNHSYTLTSQTVTIRGHVASLDCSGNQLTGLDLTRSTALISLNCSNNRLSNLDLSENRVLKTLNCVSNQLNSLDLSNHSTLESLSCEKNQLIRLNLSGCSGLKELSCHTNQLIRLDISGCRALTTLKCNKNQLTSLNLSDCVALQEFYCPSNKLTSLDFYTCRALTKLDCSDNALSGIDLLQCRELSWLRCSINQIKTSAMTALITSLPDRQGKTAGMLQVVDKESTKEGNLCFADHVTKAKAKNWQAQSYQSNTWSDYAGSEVPTFAVTSSVTTGGMVAIIGAPDLTKVPYGTELTVITEFADGYKLTALTANGKDILATKKFLVTEATEVKATFMPLTCSVSLIFNQEEGTITVPGVSNLDEVVPDTELTIEVTPAAGYELTSLTANGRDILATKKVVVTENMTIKATFAKKHLKVSTEKVGEGLFEVTGADDLNSVLYGTELTVSVTPATGYELTSLMANETDISATKKVIVKENLTIKATFTKKVFAVTLSKEGEGTLAASGAEDLKAVPYGTEVTIVATPATGYELKSIEANGTDITATKKVVVREAVAVKATFVKKTFAVELTKTGEGTLVPSGAEDLSAVPYGTQLTITATPAEGYELVALVANNVDISDTKSIEVTERMTITATFAKKNFAVTFDKVGEGSITATGASNLNSVAYGTELTIVATPAEGYELVSITAGGTDITASKKVVVTGNLTVKATFTKKSFAVTLTKEGEGTISATGASNFNSVAYGTELTIKATPAEGYELTALTANGTDILATKKVVVTDNMTVKATFTKKSFAVSLTKEGEGTITATGASNLNSVAYGTELTIVATPAEGYELTALTGNGTDILATKKVVVEGNLTVKATFEKKTFAVTLTSNEHGDITIVEPVDLKAVPYGTTLTVKATGKNAQCVLTELTANGEDILATQSFVVTDVTEVKATFVDHTGVETTVTQQTQLYPNPATDYVIVEGVAPASEVMLHSMTGERLYASRADDRGTLQIDLTPYADGVYLVCVAGETYRVVVRH